MSNQIELRHLRYFQALAKELHFKKAADSIFISQPGLSMQIKQLEDYLGVQLFERDKRHVNLTEAGKFFKSESAFILNNVGNLVKQVQRLAHGNEGEIKIGFVGSAMQNVIPELILKTTAIQPELHFTFEELRNDKQVANLLQNELDLGFVRLNKVPQDLIIKPIFQDTFSLVVSDKHCIAKEGFKSVSQLKDDAFILFKSSYSPTYFRQIISICEDHGFYPNIVHNSVHASTIYRLVENGLGVSIVPTSLKFGYQMDVRFIELSDIRQKAELSLVWSKKNRNPALQNVLNIVVPEMIKKA